MSENQSNLLAVVIDVNPVWWGKQLLRNNSDLSFTKCIDSLIVFCNMHLMLNQNNKLCLIAVHTKQNKFLYPKHDAGDDTNSVDSDSGPKMCSDGRYESFAELDEIVRDEIRDLILNDTSREIHSDCILAGAMSMALCCPISTYLDNSGKVKGSPDPVDCWICSNPDQTKVYFIDESSLTPPSDINRISKECPIKESVSSRILVIKGSEDHASQYMNFMSVVFTAQKLNVVIDACILDHESGLLQQASDITDGVYLKVPQLSGLLEYLLCLFLPDAGTRLKLTLPPRIAVDHRAACFCHRTLIDVGYVCSVCLSIFCTFSPICSTCHATFKFLAPAKALKKKVSKK